VWPRLSPRPLDADIDALGGQVTRVTIVDAAVLGARC